MSDRGIFRTTIAIENPTRRGERQELPDVMVDAGREMTWVPRPMLESLGIASERTMRFITADGRELEREIGFANVYAGERGVPDVVMFAEPGDMVLLGARSLEGLNRRVDLARKALVPAGPIPAGTAVSARAA